MHAATHGTLCKTNSPNKHYSDSIFYRHIKTPVYKPPTCGARPRDAPCSNRPCCLSRGACSCGAPHANCLGGAPHGDHPCSDSLPLVLSSRGIYGVFIVVACIVVLPWIVCCTHHTFLSGDTLHAPTTLFQSCCLPVEFPSHSLPSHSSPSSQDISARKLGPREPIPCPLVVWY